MTKADKGKSPFYPGQPVPADLFVGRAEQIDRIMTRGARQVAAGKPVAMFIEGEYGIGKSSIAGFTQWMAEREHGLYPIYAPIGGAQTMEDVGAAVLEGTVRSGAFNPRHSEKVLNWLSKYVGEQSLFGITFHAEALRRDAPAVVSAMLPFLSEVTQRLEDAGVHGVFLVLDEIDGIAKNPTFSHFIKGLLDSNALSKKPVALLLMLCGVSECRGAMIHAHPPVDRLFDVIDIVPMSEIETGAFFEKAFSSVGMSIEKGALGLMTHYSAGFPKIIHLIGDAAFWLDTNGVIDVTDAVAAVITAAEDVGKKYVDQQVYRALRSADYRSILKKMAGVDSLKQEVDRFRKAEVAALLTQAERKKFNNFLQKMKSLKVIRSGDVKGEYIFNMRMVGLYIWLKGL